jgi:hypothetical protein
MDDAVPAARLRGGNVGVVVRVGDTVRRPAGPWTRAVDAVLQHLECVGFEGAPRALGYDDLGRQVLSLVEGYVSPGPGDLSVDRLRAVGRLIREFHDAMETFVMPPDAVWNVAVPPDRHDLICHNDLAPWNLVRNPARPVLIDWDGAGPASRLWDLAYALAGFVPLAPSYDLDDEEELRRFAALVDGYQLDPAYRGALVDLLPRRINATYELLRDGHDRDVEPWATLWVQGHGRYWSANAQYVSRRRKALLGALGG